MTRFALGIDIGGTKIAAALVSPDGQARALRRVPTPKGQGANAILDAMITLGKDVLAAASPPNATIAIGVGAAGHIDYTRGVVVYAADTLPGWGGAAVGATLQAALGLPVVVDNDVNAMALGEHRFGAGRRFPNALYVTVGTGVGGAIMFGGALWRGTSWSAGELGHLVLDVDGARQCSCGARGHVEAYTAGPAIAARYCQLADVTTFRDLHAVAALAQRGDAHAQQAIQEGAHMLGTALGGLLTVLDVDALIIGGGVAELGERWWQPLEAALHVSPLPGPQRMAFRRAELGNDAVVVGAAWLALTSVGAQHERKA
jgi:glucokinase